MGQHQAKVLELSPGWPSGWHIAKHLNHHLLLLKHILTGNWNVSGTVRTWNSILKWDVDISFQLNLLLAWKFYSFSSKFCDFLKEVFDLVIYTFIYDGNAAKRF